MSKPIDHIAYLSQEIGPRPAGTEEEQQAALYITERFQKEAGLSVNIEDFTCNSNAAMPMLICSIVTIASVALGLFVPIAAIPAIVACVLSAAIFVAETCDKPVLSQLFMKGVSQNVVAKYEPENDPSGPGARRRKVILVAHYDSGKVRHDLTGFMPSVQRPLQYAALVSMCVLPFVLAAYRFAFGGEGPVAIALMVLAIIGALIVAVPAAFAVIEKASAYNEGANSNASGVAVMLEVARRIGSGEAQADAPHDATVHGEQAAYDAGVVPEGASLSYDDDTLAAAKAAVAAPAPIETLAAVAAKAAELHEAAEAAEAARLAQEEEERAEAERRAEEGIVGEDETQAEEEPAKPLPAGVPEWYIKATEKARKREGSKDEASDAPSYRSRYADFPDDRRFSDDASDASIDDDVIVDQEIPGSEAPVPYEEEGACDAVDAAVDEESHEASEGEAEESDDEKAEAASDESADENASEAREDEVESEDGAETADGVDPDATAALDAVDPQKDASEEAAAPDCADEAAQTSVPDASVDEVVENDDARFDDADATVAMPALAESGEASSEPISDSADQSSSDDAQDAPSPEAETGVVAEGERAGDAASPADADAAKGAEAEADGATSRLPQMMYYTQPEDRTEELRDRARKERSVVTLTDDEMQDMATPVAEAEPVAPAAQVVSLLSEEDAVSAASADKTASLSASADETAVLPALQDSAPGSDAASEADAVVSIEGDAAKAPLLESIPAVTSLPSITLPAEPSPQPVSFDDLRQRAPLANAADAKGREAAKDLLPVSVPAVEPIVPASDESGVLFGASNANVSKTGSFAAVTAIGAEPVGDALIEGIAPEDVYVDDADDSSFEGEYTETGAFAGPGYVEMPQSRMSRFFGKFRRKKHEEPESAHEWLDVDEDFDARSVGKKRGSWESFRDEEDTWNGGAFDALKARAAGKDDEGDRGEEDVSAPARLSAPFVTHDAFAAALAAANAAAEAKGEATVSESVEEFEDDVQQIYSFAAGDINTEVWFVALGSELAGNGGIKAFLAEHASDMRGAIIVNLESLGAGTLSYLEKEGRLKQASCSPRMKRFIRKASQASGVDVAPAKLDWRESAASYAQKHRMQAMTIAGMDGVKPAYYGQADDVIENIDAAALDRSADMVVELLKNI
ncbi:MAG: hypothetical protein Q4B35_04015 [Slackia sp.]|nr:hypothetical protein [Slackia sp.]